MSINLGIGNFVKVLGEIIIRNCQPFIYYKRSTRPTWFESQHIFPHVVAEFDDSALLKLFGSEGFGIFCAPSAIAEHVAQQYQVVKCGEVPEIKERFYALTSKNQAAQGIVKAVINEAKRLLN
ncbi:MAG: hypothetical protein GY770_13425 [Aestuariibacter sp.]|nr:hypothetical protein [Aestuariibacter sp.]